MRWKIGMRAATVARMDAVYVICGINGERATLRDAAGETRTAAVRNLRPCLRAESRARLEARAKLEKKSPDEMQKFYQGVFGRREKRLRIKLFGIVGKRRAARRRGRPRKADAPERIRERLRHSLRVAGGV